MREGSGSGAALNALVSVRQRNFHRLTDNELQKDDKILSFLGRFQGQYIHFFHNWTQGVRVKIVNDKKL